MHREHRKSEGFTRTELAVVLTVVAVLGTLAMPMLAREQNRDWRIVCLRHLSQLANAMAMYAADNRDYLPPNPDDGNTTPGRNWCPGSAGPGETDECTSEILLDPSRSLLINYLGGDISVFKCPEDMRIGKYRGPNPMLKGAFMPSVRNVALNITVGTDPNFVGCKIPAAGAFLDGNHGHTYFKTWYTYGKASDFIHPGPANTFTFIEEDPVSVNDGALQCMGPNAKQLYQMIDWPSTLHGMAGTVAFADGHVETHHWVDPRTRLVSAALVGRVVQPNSPDLKWLADHATALIKP